MSKRAEDEAFNSGYLLALDMSIGAAMQAEAAEELASERLMKIRSTYDDPNTTPSKRKAGL